MTPPASLASPGLAALHTAAAVTVRPATVPLIVGGTAMSVAMTVVVLSVALAPIVSVSVMVNWVVTVQPGGTSWAVGVNTSPSSAVVTAAAEPVTV